MTNYTLKCPGGANTPVGCLTLGDYRKPFTVTGDVQLKNGSWAPTTVNGRLESVRDFENPHKPYNILGLVKNRRLVKIRVIKDGVI